MEGEGDTDGDLETDRILEPFKAGEELGLPHGDLPGEGTGAARVDKTAADAAAVVVAPIGCFELCSN